MNNTVNINNIKRNKKNKNIKYDYYHEINCNINI